MIRCTSRRRGRRRRRDPKHAAAAAAGPARRVAAVAAVDAAAAPTTPSSPLRRSASAPGVMMESVRRELAAEHERRVRAEEESRLIRYLSPFERFLLFCYARVARLAHIPRPRFLVCGGPLFWCLVVPGLWFRWAYGVSPLALVAPGEDPHADPWFADARRPATDVLRRRGRRRASCPCSCCGHDARPRPPARRGAPRAGDRRPSRARARAAATARPPRRSTALEVWQGVGCFAGSHRRRLWSSPSMLSQFVLRPACLQRHLALNGTTWDDPADIKVRASSGLGAADAFGPLNLWGELMANLAILGYDETSLRLLGFDWRLSAQRLEARDGFFTQVKAEVELLGALSGAKVAVLAHSLGANHFVHFMRWVEAREPGWVERRVARFVPICGALLGSAKALAYLVTGEMTDAVGMGPLAQLFESHGGIQRRRRGPHAVLGVRAGAPAQGRRRLLAHGRLRRPRRAAGRRPRGPRARRAANGTVAPRSSLAKNRTMAVDAALDWLRAMLPAYGALLDGEYDLTGPPAAGRRRRRRRSRAWGNGLLAPLPKAPSLEIYCLYGTGRSTPKTFEFAWTRPPRAAPAFDDAASARPAPSLLPPRAASPRQVPSATS
ncbi:O-acyltransferase [Aureococcus anophagefferens]|nr:O-acyltransferase [Aureococcus anophagefferens]